MTNGMRAVCAPDILPASATRQMLGQHKHMPKHDRGDTCYTRLKQWCRPGNRRYDATKRMLTNTTMPLSSKKALRLVRASIWLRSPHILRTSRRLWPAVGPSGLRRPLLRTDRPIRKRLAPNLNLDPYTHEQDTLRTPAWYATVPWRLHAALLRASADQSATMPAFQDASKRQYNADKRTPTRPDATDKNTRQQHVNKATSTEDQPPTRHCILSSSPASTVYFAKLVSRTASTHMSFISFRLFAISKLSSAPANRIKRPPSTMIHQPCCAPLWRHGSQAECSILQGKMAGDGAACLEASSTQVGEVLMRSGYREGAYEGGGGRRCTRRIKSGLCDHNASAPMRRTPASRASVRCSLRDARSHDGSARSKPDGRRAKSTRQAPETDFLDEVLRHISWSVDSTARNEFGNLCDL